MRLNDTHKFFIIITLCIISGYIIAHPIAHIVGAFDDYIEIDRKPAWTTNRY